MNDRLKINLIEIVFIFQKILFFISSCLIFWIPKNNNDKKLIIGRETAGLLNLYAKIFDCYSINTESSNFGYNVDYSVNFSRYSKLAKYIILPLIYPLILKRFSNIWYFSSASFFLANDGREWEFSKAKKHGLNIICFFLGSDIRSLKLAQELSASIDLDHWSNHIGITANRAEVSDKRSKVFSNAADKYANHIFSAENDNISYIKSKIHLLPMPVTRNSYVINDNKWKNLSQIKIFHCPSSPLIKGTQIVTSVIKRLKNEGYIFDFVLLQNVSNEEVLKELDNTHIVLNEFYGYLPGLFGIEALEANCLLLTSASKDVEPALFDGSENAWVPTMYHEIYENLKYYLDNIDKAKIIADQGTHWAKKHCSHEACISYLNSKVST